jgi:putative nucleotidyltransferase with HDIG domain
MNEADIKNIFPEVDLIADEQLRESCVNTWLAAINAGGWDKEDFCKLPFVLSELKECPVLLIDHVRNVTRLAADIQERFDRQYGQYIVAERDAVIAGALLHDVGKLLEYGDEGGNYVYTDHGQYVRHPLGGALLAERCGVPDKVIHIIATHSFEGDRSFRTPEAFIVRNADSLNFLFLSFRFPLQMDHK